MAKKVETPKSKPEPAKKVEKAVVQPVEPVKTSPVVQKVEEKTPEPAPKAVEVKKDDRKSCPREHCSGKLKLLKPNEHNDGGDYQCERCKTYVTA